MHVILDIRPFRFSACNIKMLVKALGRDYVCVIGVVKGGGGQWGHLPPQAACSAQTQPCQYMLYQGLIHVHVNPWLY